ncbi:hypothetical protein BDU57DRAFT_510538 [Ampelomyces quisqualis]|uniref:Uncharacterized protein n=1 Tax=Ampelomyces quisqualis TaxID=50730 RepID=A0A6A5R1R2_AMPQU|nr:hypothetical protein BDU57DRAFT_510538 [Ampelomyces quisqualis]
MRSFGTLALLALPLFGPVSADDAAVATKSVEQPNLVYSSAQEAFRDLLNALPEESLHAALSGLKDFQSGVFESHHRGVEQVHKHNPALATKLIVAAVQDLKKRQTPSNGTTTAAPPPQSSPQAPETNSPPPSSAAPPPANTPPAASPTDRAVIVNVPQTTTNQQGQTVVETTSVLSQATASVPVTLVRTTNGAVITTTEQRPAVIHITTDSVGRLATLTSAAQFAPTAGEVRTETNAQGSTFVTTYTPGGGKISSVKLLTTTDAEGRPSTVTSYTFVDAAQTPGPAAAGDPSRTSRSPGLQTGAAVPNMRVALGLAAAGGVLALVG